jgi:hypothetical protein
MELMILSHGSKTFNITTGAQFGCLCKTLLESIYSKTSLIRILLGRTSLNPDMCNLYEPNFFVQQDKNKETVTYYDHLS